MLLQSNVVMEFEMATNGTTVAITTKEKIEFNPLFVKYVQKEYSDKQILAELDGNKKKFSRFQLYANGLIDLLKTQKIEKRIAEIEESKVLLKKGIEKHKSIIHQSRTTAVKATIRQAIRI